MRDVSLVIFTDLDGTLLDHDTYEFNQAEAGLDAVAQARVPLIMCSSKTRAEIEWLQRHLGMNHPFISENGGALFVPDGYFPFPLTAASRLGSYQVLEFGSRYPELVQGLRRVAARQNIRVLGFDEMTVDEIARTCGLSVTEARLAKRREYDEPFRVLSGGAPGRVRLINALRREGFRCTRGSRFDHVTGLTDKGIAVGQLRAMYEREAESIIITAGLGDSLNDLPLLAAVDIPIVVRNNEADAARLLRRLPAACLTEHPGPGGWGQAVSKLVHSLVLSQHEVMQ